MTATTVPLSQILKNEMLIGGRQPTTEDLIAASLQSIAHSLDRIADQMGGGSAGALIVGGSPSISDEPGTLIIGGPEHEIPGTNPHAKPLAEPVPTPQPSGRSQQLRDAISDKVNEFASFSPGVQSDVRKKCLLQLNTDIQSRLQCSVKHGEIDEDHLHDALAYLDGPVWQELTPDGWPTGIKRSFSAMMRNYDKAQDLLDRRDNRLSGPGSGDENDQPEEPQQET